MNEYYFNTVLAAGKKREILERKGNILKMVDIARWEF